MAHNDRVTSVAFHNSGRYLASAAQDASFKIYDLRMGQVLYGHEGSASMVNFSRDGKLFATAAGNDCIVWDSNLSDPEQEKELSRVK